MALAMAMGRRLRIMSENASEETMAGGFTSSVFLFQDNKFMKMIYGVPNARRWKALTIEMKFVIDKSCLIRRDRQNNPNLETQEKI